MKRILPLVVTAVVPSLAIVLAAALALPASSAWAAPEPQAQVVSVDYVLALLDAGIDQDEIIRRIVDKDLTFRLERGDVDRLRDAGAGDDLVEVVTAEQDTSQWERPHRLDDENYVPGYSSFTFSYGYPYPYYYYPYYPSYYSYAPYGYHFYYSSPHYYNYPRYSYRTTPRGGGWGRGAPRGGSPRSAPRGGVSPRTSPRGSHHH